MSLLALLLPAHRADEVVVGEELEELHFCHKVPRMLVPLPDVITAHAFVSFPDNVQHCLFMIMLIQLSNVVKLQSQLFALHTH